MLQEINRIKPTNSFLFVKDNEKLTAYFDELLVLSSIQKIELN